MKEMTISQIADIHHRTPGTISYKLKSLGLINHNVESRGYLEYKNSNLYKEIVKTNKSDKQIRKEIELKEKKENKVKAKTESLSVITSCSEITELRNEISDLKNDVKEILRLMNAIYDFESQ